MLYVWVWGASRRNCVRGCCGLRKGRLLVFSLAQRRNFGFPPVTGGEETSTADCLLVFWGVCVFRLGVCLLPVSKHSRREQEETIAYPLHLKKFQQRKNKVAIKVGRNGISQIVLCHCQLCVTTTGKGRALTLLAVKLTGRRWKPQQKVHT